MNNNIEEAVMENCKTLKEGNGENINNEMKLVAPPPPPHLLVPPPPNHVNQSGLELFNSISFIPR